MFSSEMNGIIARFGPIRQNLQCSLPKHPRTYFVLPAYTHISFQKREEGLVRDTSVVGRKQHWTSHLWCVTLCQSYQSQYAKLHHNPAGHQFSEIPTPYSSLSTESSLNTTTKCKCMRCHWICVWVWVLRRIFLYWGLEQSEECVTISNPQ